MNAGNGKFVYISLSYPVTALGVRLRVRYRVKVGKQ